MDERSLAEDQGTDDRLVRVGRQLAECRAAAGFTQDQLAGQLHMGVEQLAALERGDQEHLPEPVFIKAMVRRLSSHLGLDADAMVQSLGPLTTNPARRHGGRPSFGAINPPKRTTLNPVPLLALAGLAGLGAVVWSNASELTSLAQRLRPVNQALVESREPATPPQPVETEATTSVEKLTVSSPATAPPILTISSSEPSWIALRREGVVEFEGLLNGERRIENPELVEIYAGRPDLVQLTLPEVETRPLGTVDDIRWIRLNPER